MIFAGVLVAILSAVINTGIGLCREDIMLDKN